MDEAQYLALPIAQRKALQQQWQAKGLYVGPIDGKSGDGTRTALAALKSAQGNEAQTQLRGRELDLETARLANEKEQRDGAERARLGQEGASKEREAAANPWMDTFVPFAAGAGVGGAYGELTNRGLNKFEEGNARALREISDELGPTKNLTGSQLNRSRARGAAKAAERFAPTGPIAKAASGVGRLASYGIPAGVVYNEYRNYQGRANDEKLTETERKANQQIANGLLGVTTGIGVEGGRRFFFPSREPGVGKAEMRVQAAREFANRMDADAVAKGPTKAALTAQAEAAGVAVKSRMTKAQIEAAIAGVKQISSKLPAMAGPLAAGALAYGLTPDRAEAADGSAPADNSQALTNAGIAGGTAAGAGYGLSKLANFAPVKSLLSVASKASGPLMLNDMAMQAHRGIYGSGPQYLDVPEKSPVRSQLSNYAAEANGPLSSASALQIPGNIPPNAARDAEAAAIASEGPSPARQAYGDQKFDDALSGFLAMIQEHNSSVSQGAQR